MTGFYCIWKPFPTCLESAHRPVRCAGGGRRRPRRWTRRRRPDSAGRCPAAAAAGAASTAGGRAARRRPGGGNHSRRGSSAAAAPGTRPRLAAFSAGRARVGNRCNPIWNRSIILSLGHRNISTTERTWAMNAPFKFLGGVFDGHHQLVEAFARGGRHAHRRPTVRNKSDHIQ